MIKTDRKKCCLRCDVNNILKLCFINISKNASTTCRKMFSTKHVYYDHKIYKDYFKILILRDPKDRIKSSFSEVLKLRKDGPYLITKKMKFFESKNFGVFLDEIKDNFYDSHVIPQHWFWEDKGLDLEDIDKIILFENLKTDLPNLMKKYKIKKQLYENKKSKSFDIDVSKYEDKINDIYKKDVIIYNKIKNNKLNI